MCVYCISSIWRACVCECVSVWGCGDVERGRGRASTRTDKVLNLLITDRAPITSELHGSPCGHCCVDYQDR